MNRKLPQFGGVLMEWLMLIKAIFLGQNNAPTSRDSFCACYSVKALLSPVYLLRETLAHPLTRE